MVLTAAIAVAASAEPLPPLVWDWDRSHRLYAEAEVNLPEMMWWEAEFNKNARVFGFQIRAVLVCDGTEKETARKRLVQCAFEDVSLVGAALPGDQGRLQPILDEYDQLLTDAVLQLVIRTDGRITDVNLDQVPFQNLRTRQRKETLRQLARFLAAGLEVPLSPRGEPLWVTGEALFCTLPTSFGSNAPVEAVHQGAREGATVQIVSQGRGTILPSMSANQYTCGFESLTTWDPSGALVERVWTMRGEPTASSAIAQGAAGFPYLQKGSIRRLEAGEAVDLGETREVKPDVVSPSALQQAPGPSHDPKWTE